jgi:hypothetical protein
MMAREYKDTIERFKGELKELNKKTALTPADLDSYEKALKIIEKAYCCHKCEEEEEEEQKWMNQNEYSERRGRAANGRYVSRMINQLEDMREEAPDYHTRKTLDRAITHLEDGK